MILIKFDIDPCIHSGDPLDQKTADGWTSFQLYIVDERISYELNFVVQQFEHISLSLGHLFGSNYLADGKRKGGQVTSFKLLYIKV